MNKPFEGMEQFYYCPLASLLDEFCIKKVQQ